MITNLEGLTTYLVAWMQDQAKQSGTKNGCVGLSGGIDSAVVFALCCRAFPKTVAVMMPCHSRPESLERAREVVRSQSVRGTIHCFTVDLAYAFSAIVDQLAHQEGAFRKLLGLHDMEDPDHKKFCEGSLRSCLRTPVLDYVSKCHDALIYGTGNRDEDEIFRYYNKRGDGAVDNNPIVGLHKSEVRQLAAYLGLPQSVIDATPTADLWGSGAEQTDEGELGITYEEIEWVTRMNYKLNILYERGNFESDPDGYLRAWEWAEDGETRLSGMDGFRKRYDGKFTERQFEIIEKAFHMEKASRHKVLPPPGPTRDEINFFVL